MQRSAASASSVDGAAQRGRGRFAPLLRRTRLVALHARRLAGLVSLYRPCLAFLRPHCKSHSTSPSPLSSPIRLRLRQCQMGMDRQSASFVQPRASPPPSPPGLLFLMSSHPRLMALVCALHFQWVTPAAARPARPPYTILDGSSLHQRVCKRSPNRPTLQDV